MDILEAVNSFVSEVVRFEEDKRLAIQGVTSVKKYPILEKLRADFQKKYNIKIDYDHYPSDIKNFSNYHKKNFSEYDYYSELNKRETRFYKSYSGTIRLIVTDVQEYFKSKKGLLGKQKYEAWREICTRIENSNKGLSVYTPDIAKADQLKIGSVIEIKGDFNLVCYYDEDGKLVCSIRYKEPITNFSIISLSEGSNHPSVSNPSPSCVRKTNPQSTPSTSSSSGSSLNISTDDTLYAQIKHDLQQRSQKSTSKSSSPFGNRTQGSSGNKQYTKMKCWPQQSKSNIFPNDPCPCGSGLKYKSCCMNKSR